MAVVNKSSSNLISEQASKQAKISCTSPHGEHCMLSIVTEYDYSIEIILVTKLYVDSGS